MQFTIERAKWLRGETDSWLLRPKDQKMCCLGFFCLAAGIERDRIWMKTTPQVLCRDEEQIPHELQGLVDSMGKPTNSALCTSLIEVNDDNSITDEEREQGIIRLFAKIGHEVTFV
jgi:hypothetical protein